MPDLITKNRAGRPNPWGLEGAAGFNEGEGNFAFRPMKWSSGGGRWSGTAGGFRFDIGQSSPDGQPPDSLFWLREVVENIVGVRRHPFYRCKIAKKGKQTPFRYQLFGAEALKVMQAMAPYSDKKRTQYEAAVAAEAKFKEENPDRRRLRPYLHPPVRGSGQTDLW